MTATIMATALAPTGVTITAMTTITVSLPFIVTTTITDRSPVDRPWPTLSPDRRLALALATRRASTRIRGRR